MSLWATLLIPSASDAQLAKPEYLVLDTAKTSTMQKELQEAADRGYRLVAGQGSWQLSAILEKTPGDAEAIEYVLLSTSKSGTMQKEMDESSAQGYRFASVLGIGKEVIIAMHRKRGTTARTHRQMLLATSKISTMERELAAEAVKGFSFVGQTVFTSVFGGLEFVAILERAAEE